MRRRRIVVQNRNLMGLVVEKLRNRNRRRQSPIVVPHAACDGVLFTIQPTQVHSCFVTRLLNTITQRLNSIIVISLCHIATNTSAASRQGVRHAFFVPALQERRLASPHLANQLVSLEQLQSQFVLPHLSQLTRRHARLVQPISKRLTE